MNKTIVFGSTLGVLTLGAGTYLYFNAMHKKKTQEEFLDQLDSFFNPSTKGLSESKAFDIKHLENVKKSTNQTILTLKPSTAKRIAKQIKNVWGTWWSGDSEVSKIKGILQSLGDQVRVSQVAKAYLDEYRISLKDDINSRLDSKQVSSILSVTDNLDNVTLV